MRIADAYELVKSKGLRMTPQKRAIFTALFEAECPQSAQDILDTLSPRYPDLSLDTVYRTLRWLVKEDLANTVVIQGRHADKYEWRKTHHHHRICLGCGEIKCLPNCNLDERAMAGDDFTTVRHVLEIYGYCRQCQTERKEAR